MEDFREVEEEHMEKVADLKRQFKIKGNHNGRKNLLVEEVTTLEVDILVILGVIKVEKERKYLGLKVLVINVVKKGIYPLNVLTLERRLKVIVEAL